MPLELIIKPSAIIMSSPIELFDFISKIQIPSTKGLIFIFHEWAILAGITVSGVRINFICTYTSRLGFNL